MANAKKHRVLRKTNHARKYETTNYCSMCENPEVLRSVRVSGIE